MRRLPDDFLLWTIKSSMLFFSLNGSSLFRAKNLEHSSPRTSGRVEKGLLSDFHGKVQRLSSTTTLSLSL